MKKHYYVIILAILSFIIAIFDTSSGIYIAVLANVVANVITLSRQKAQIVKIKKKIKLIKMRFQNLLEKKLNQLNFG